MKANGVNWYAHRSKEEYKTKINFFTVSNELRHFKCSEMVFSVKCYSVLS